MSSERAGITVTVANGKGGVGKSSTVCNVAGLAATSGWKVLVIDLDPQGNCGHILGYTWEGKTDEGAHLTDALTGRATLAPTLREVRPGLDVIAGGRFLDDLDAMLGMRSTRGEDVRFTLAEAVEPLLGEYDLVMIDTPPTRPLLLRLALSATRWMIIPTRPGRTSIEGLRTLSAEIGAARPANPELEILGALLFDVDSSAKNVRRNATEDINALLDGRAPVFKAWIRHASAPATLSEEKGQLVHELAQQVSEAEPYWKALREGRKPSSVPGSAPALATDYFDLTREILDELQHRGGAVQEGAVS